MNSEFEDFLRDSLRYVPETGEFLWNITKSTKCKPGSLAGSVKSDGYRHINIGGKFLLEHRLAWFFFYGYWPENDIDHIDNLRDNNKISNLREATRQQNIRNSRLRSSTRSGFKGVTFEKRTGRWNARIFFNGKQISLGTFSTAEEAHQAYCISAEKNFGQFARKK